MKSMEERKTRYIKEINGRGPREGLANAEDGEAQRIREKPKSRGEEEKRNKILDIPHQT